MNLASELLQALAQSDGDAVVLHSGETAYIDSPSGQTELWPDPLPLDTVRALLGLLLPADAQQTFHGVGAIRHECAPMEKYPGERFVVVALREDGELWVELRREGRKPEAPASAGHDDFAFPDRLAVVESAYPELSLPAADELWGPKKVDAPADAGTFWARQDLNLRQVETGGLDFSSLDVPEIDSPAIDLSSLDFDGPDPAVGPEVSPSPGYEMPALLEEEAPASAPAIAAVPAAGVPKEHEVEVPVVIEEDEAPARPAVVLPMTKHTIHQEVLEPIDTLTGGLDRLLRIVAARGGTTLYITSGTSPAMRIDGEIHLLDGEPTLNAAAAETLVLGVVPERTRESMRTGNRAEWISDVPGLGRVRCVTFRDHRGAGGIFRIVSVRPASVEQLGLTREVQALALEPEGLVLVVGPRSSGKGTLTMALVDLINRTRRDHVITIESEIQVVHDSRGSMISQREIRGDNHEVVSAVRSALREDPDVLVIDELRGNALVQLAVEAAGSGRLVIAGLQAHSTSAAIDRVIDGYSPEERRHAQLALAQHLRGAIAQVLLRKPGGGRLAAREVLLNTPAVGSLIADGKTSQLPLAIEAGRKAGMVSLHESLVALVKTNAVDAAEALGRANDRREFLEVMKRHGLDTTPLERLA